jgi:cell shape-determining protein MreD
VASVSGAIATANSRAILDLYTFMLTGGIAMSFCGFDTFTDALRGRVFNDLIWQRAHTSVTLTSIQFKSI